MARAAVSDGQRLSRAGGRRETIWLIIVVCTIVLSYGVGCWIGEDSSGGARGDFSHFHWLSIEQFTRMPWSLAVRDYQSATNPLMYMIASLLPVNQAGFRAISQMLAVAICGVISVAYYVRFAKFGFGWSWCMFAGSTILLSPGFRSSGIWGDTDHMPLLFCGITSILLSWFEKTGPAITPARGLSRIASVAAVAACAFYTRQFYAFLPVVTAWTLLKRDRVPAIAIFAIFSAAMVPEVLLIDVWGGMNPPSFQKHTHPSLGNALLVGANICLFALPLTLGCVRRPLADVLPRWWDWRAGLASVAGLAVFLIALHGLTWPTVGGGLVIKLGLLMGRLGPLFILAMAYGGLLTAVVFAARSATNVVLVVTFVLPFLIAVPTFQRYFEPVMVVAVLLFSDMTTARLLFTKRVLICNFAFSTLLLTVSWLHYHVAS